MTKEEFLSAAKEGASNAGHPWPGYAAAEAALESAWGASRLAILGNNLFGRKQSTLNPVYETLDLPTKEYSPSVGWYTVTAHWVKYPSWSDCFTDRLALLKRLAPAYPNYENALNAIDGESFVRDVSLSWSTDPERAQKVIDIYNAHLDVLNTEATT